MNVKVPVPAQTRPTRLTAAELRARLDEVARQLAPRVSSEISLPDGESCTISLDPERLIRELDRWVGMN